MTPLTVVDILYNQKYRYGFFLLSIEFFVFPLAFQHLEKAFCNCVIETVTATAHDALLAV